MSSSSAELSCIEQEPFNPDRCLRVLPIVSVVKRDGTQIPVNNQGIALEGGANAAFSIEEENDEIVLSVNAGAGVEDPYLRQKAEAIASLSADNPSVSGPFQDPVTGVTPDGPAWEFTVDSTWIGSINNVLAEADTGAFFLVNDVCTHIGEFVDPEDPGYPQEVIEEGSSSSVPQSHLKILDICAPCLDCLEYQRLFDYMTRLETFYNYLFELTRSEDTDSPPEHPDGGIRDTFVGVHPQLMAALRYWDYLVHVNSVKISAQSIGQGITAAAYYRNISVDPVGDPNPDGVSLQIKFELLRDGVAWEGLAASFLDIRILDRSGKPSATQDGSPAYTPAASSAHTVTVDLKTTNPMASGEEIYADVALMFRNANLFNDPASDFTMRVTLTVNPTHLDPVSQERETIVYFQPPEPGESIIPGGSS
jgi:hypothetical protein